MGCLVLFSAWLLTIITLILTATAKITTTPEGGSYHISAWASFGIMALFLLAYWVGYLNGKPDRP